MAIEGLSINDLQSAIEQAGAQWVPEENDITALTAEERDKLLGYVPGPDDPSLEESERQAAEALEAFASEGAGSAEAAGYPASYDLRSGGYITPVKNQGGCGSCVAFGAVGAAEGAYRKLHNKPNVSVDLSEAHLFYCHARSEGRRCNNGWWSSKALDAFRDKGVVDEACYPYTAGDQDCSNLCASWRGRLWRVTKWERLTKTSDMKKWLATKGPLVACYTVYSDFYAYRSGIYRHVSGTKRGGHCVTCVGYNDTQKYWICKNSWGKGFGEDGYFKIAYGQCGIDNFMDAIHGIEPEWLRNVRINGLWANNQDRNAWVHVSGHGWRRVSHENDTILFDMLSALIAAKAGNRPVNLKQSRGVIKQVYLL